MLKRMWPDEVMSPGERKRPRPNPPPLLQQERAGRVSVLRRLLPTMLSKDKQESAVLHAPTTGFHFSKKSKDNVYEMQGQLSEYRVGHMHGYRHKSPFTDTSRLRPEPLFALRDAGLSAGVTLKHVSESDANMGANRVDVILPVRKTNGLQNMNSSNKRSQDDGIVDKLSKLIRSALQLSKQGPKYTELEKLEQEMELDIQRQREEDEKWKRAALAEKDTNFLPLTEDHIDSINDFLASDPNAIINEVGKNEIKLCDIKTLKPGIWLNEVVIDAYMYMCWKRSEAYPTLPKTFTFNCAFYNFLSSHGYQKVSRFTKRAKIDIFACDYVIVPCNINSSHWVCVRINFKKKQLECYDSLATGKRPTVLDTLWDFMEGESKSKRGIPFNRDGWTEFYGLDGVPQQDNSSDCGVFASTYAEYMSREDDFDFSQEHMPYLRQRFILEICTGAFLPRRNWHP